MAEPKRISQLDAASPLTGVEILAAVQNSRTVKITAEQLKTFSDTSCQCTLVSRYSSVSTGSASGTYYLQTYSLPGDTLTTNGSWLDIYVTGAFASNSNTKTAGLRIAQGAYSSTFSFPNGSYNNQSYEAHYRLQRVSATDFKIFQFYNATGNVTFIETLSNIRHNNVTSSVNFASDIQLEAFGYNGSASSDVTNESFIIILHKLDVNS